MTGLLTIAMPGPFFHWWYGTLEKTVAGMHFTSTYLASAVKLAITQLVMTPPFLVFTLAYIQYFMTLDAKETVVAVKRTFAAALFLNWKVSYTAQTLYVAIIIFVTTFPIFN